MTEQINDQISAFIDDELSPDENTLLVRRFERDAKARSQAVRYTMIGAALRGEALAHSSLLRNRIAAALDGAPPAVERRAHGWQARYGKPLLGVGIAAAVAVAAIDAASGVFLTSPDQAAVMSVLTVRPAIRDAITSIRPTQPASASVRSAGPVTP